MANRKNLKPKDIEEELDKVSGPRNLNPPARYFRKKNRGEVRAKKETEQRGKAEYPGTKE